MTLDKHWTRRAAEAIDADVHHCQDDDPPAPSRLIRIARLVAIIDQHRPRDIGQAELEDALRRLDALEQKTEAALRQVQAVEAVKRPVYPHGV